MYNTHTHTHDAHIYKDEMISKQNAREKINPAIKREFFLVVLHHQILIWVMEKGDSDNVVDDNGVKIERDVAGNNNNKNCYKIVKAWSVSFAMALVG